MKPRIRIRPRIWLALPKSHARWGWVPLSLIFRRQRLYQKPLENAVGSHVSLFNVLSFLSKISHYHTNERRQIFARSIQHQYFFLNRTAGERLGSTKDRRHPEASVFNELRWERSIETQRYFWTQREWKQSFTTTRQLVQITKRVTEDHPRRTWSRDSRVATPVHRTFATLELPGLRNFNPASALSPRPQEMPAVIGRATLEAAAEDQLMPRLRKADPLSAAVPAVPFTAPAVKQVWRQSQSPSREPSGEARGLPAAAQTAAADSPTHHRVDLLPPAPASAVLPAKVEGPTMERIAEDVMKRIERHLRIERERRGM